MVKAVQFACDRNAADILYQHNKSFVLHDEMDVYGNWWLFFTATNQKPTANNISRQLHWM